MRKAVIVTDAKFRVSMVAYDGTRITAFTSTKVQARHTAEMYQEIIENGRVKYSIRIEPIN